MEREAWKATYSPWHCQESDMTDGLTHTHTHTHTHTTYHLESNLVHFWISAQKKSPSTPFEPYPAPYLANGPPIQFLSVQLLSHVRIFATP